MKNIYTWAANPAKRTVTVGDLIEAKGKKVLTQVTANNSLEAKAAEEAGFDMIIGSASNVKKVREGSKCLFYTAALELHNYCLLYTSPSPRDGLLSRMPSSA